VTVEAYLESEKTSPVKREYVGGQLYALAGASKRHNRIAGRIFSRLLPVAEAQGCQAYISDMKLRVAEKVFYYPDVMAVCKENSHPLYVEFPCLIVEVISPSTAATDRREKLEAYLKLDSLQSYLLFEAEAPRVMGYTRTGEGWLEQLWEDKGEVPVACLGLALALEDIYAGLDDLPASEG
jgi:Uma2 family endonuclease